ncbi:hypothetical protein GDO81_025169, partial [Engystomops pustulosus]
RHTRSLRKRLPGGSSLASADWRKLPSRGQASYLGAGVLLFRARAWTAAGTRFSVVYRRAVCGLSPYRPGCHVSALRPLATGSRARELRAEGGAVVYYRKRHSWDMRNSRN